MGWLLVLLACFIVLPKFGVAGETDSSRISAMLTDSPRLHIYRQLIWAIFNKPWMGYGWMQTAYAQSIAAGHVFGGVEADYAHNIILDILVWFGIPLGILLLLSFGFVIARNWRRSQIQYKLAYALLIPFALHSMLEFPYAYAFFLLPVGMLLGYLGRQVTAKDGETVKFIEIGWWVYISLTVLATLLALMVCIEYLERAEDFRILRFENRNIGTVPENFQPSSPVVLTDLMFMMEMMRYKPHRSESNERVEQLRQFVLHTHNPNAHIKLISQQILDHHFEDALGEVHRFKNLYGKEIVSWGMDSLYTANCEELATQSDKQRVCSAMMEK